VIIAGIAIGVVIMAIAALLTGISVVVQHKTLEDREGRVLDKLAGSPTQVWGVRGMRAGAILFAVGAIMFAVGLALN